jgi:hypothetical protein
MSATFINDSDLPINLGSWQTIMYGIDEYVTILVKANESTVMKSSVGEWILDTYLYDKEMVNEWTTAGMKPGKDIGKFRDKPSYIGDYSWIYDDKFEIVYDPATRTATFTKKRND